MGRRLRVVSVLAFAVSAALYVGFASTPRAGATDLSPMAWVSDADSDLASFVTSSFAPHSWGGDGSSLESLYNLVADGYNAASVDAFISSVDAAAIETGVDVAAGSAITGAFPAAVGLLGLYVAYKVGSTYFQRTNSTNFQPLAPNTNVCGTANNTGSSNCKVRQVVAGSRYCVGNDSGTTVWWTPPVSGLMYETNRVGYYVASFSGGCGTGYNPVSTKTTGGNRATIEAELGTANEYDTGGTHHILIWFVQGALASLAPVTSVGSTAVQTTGPSFAGSSDTDTQIASALRQQLTSPGDTVDGVAPSWGDNGGTPDATTTANDSQTMSCVIAGDCDVTPLVPTFTMPNCVYLQPSGCLSDMQALGFKGSLDQSSASPADFTQPVGSILSTSKVAGASVSTLAGTVVEAYTNPLACESTATENPHWSIQTGIAGSMLSYVKIVCTDTVTASYTASMYACSGDPGTEGVNLATAGCVTEATSTHTLPVTADVVATAYVPWVDNLPAGNTPDPAVAWSSGYWIATGVTTTPSAMNGLATWSQGDWQPSPP